MTGVDCHARSHLRHVCFMNAFRLFVLFSLSHKRALEMVIFFISVFSAARQISRARPTVERLKGHIVFTYRRYVLKTLKVNYI